MRKLKVASIAAAVLAASSFSQFAAAEVSANFGVTSNYLWRGVTQSSDGPSISGGIDYSDESGFYVGTWIGSVDWGSAGTENDLYLGYSGESGDFGYDVGYVYYLYPEDEYEDSNFGELYFNGSYGDLSFGIAYTVNSDIADDDPFGTGDIYVSAGYSFALPNDFGLDLTVGHYAFDSKGYDDDYTHFQADISKGDFVLTISKATDAADMTDDDLKFAVSWSASF